MARTDRKSSEAVRVIWEARQFREGIFLFPFVQISDEAFERMERKAKISLPYELRRSLESLIEARIFSVCGLTDLGASGKENILPGHLRPAAKRVAECARDLITALNRFDKLSDGKGKKIFEYGIQKNFGANPRDILHAYNEEFSRSAPTAREFNGLILGVFMSDVRDQVYNLALKSLSSPAPSEATFVRFLAALETEILRPLDQRGIEPKDKKLIIKWRRNRNDLRCALSSGDNSDKRLFDALRKSMERHLKPYDEQRAENRKYWARVIARGQERLAANRRREAADRRREAAGRTLEMSHGCGQAMGQRSPLALRLQRTVRRGHMIEFHPLGQTDDAGN